MRTKKLSVSSATNSAWVPLNTSQTPFNVSIAVDLNSAASGITYEVQHTFDDLDGDLVSSIVRSGTTVTVTFPSDNPHNLNTNDSIIVSGSGVTGMDGTFTVTVTSSTVLTYTSGTSATSTGSVHTRVVPLRVYPHEFLTAKTTSDDGNYSYPVTAVRLNVSAWTAGTATIIINQG